MFILSFNQKEVGHLVCPNFHTQCSFQAD